MIKINKGAEPNVLAVNKINWTAQLLACIQAQQNIPDTLYNRYNNDEVKNALRQECNHKCMYCESQISHISYEHIEHIKPKAKNKYPELTFDWNNLGLACQKCNMNKGDTYDTDLPFINPYIEEPALFFIGIGVLICHRPANKRGELTITILNLNRPELIERRFERIESIRRLIDKFHGETNLTLKSAIKDEIEIEIRHDKPYAFYTKSIYDALIN